MSELDLIVVVLNWNGLKDTKECLNSIRNQKNISLHTILVDNGSSDNSVQVLRKHFPELDIIELPENIGYAAGNNEGIKKALTYKCNAILVLNNDVILDENCIVNMYNCLTEKNTIGAVVPKIYYMHDKKMIWYAGGEIQWWKLTVKHYGFRKVDDGTWDSKKNIEFATGCALLICVEALRNIGFLDESYYSYFEDMDFSMRLVQAGYDVKYCPEAKLWHQVGAGTSNKNYSTYYLYYQTRNRIRAFCKSRGVLFRIYAHLVNIFFYFFIRVFYILLFSSRMRIKKIKAVSLGFWDSLIGKTGPDKQWEIK